MKIGIISDTHGKIEAWKKAEVLFAGVDLIVHSGDVFAHHPYLGCSDGYDTTALADALNGLDVPLVIAQGNCDEKVHTELLNTPIQSPYALVEHEGLRIIATHGHLFIRSQLIELGKQQKADVIVSGHTHVPMLEKADGIILLNPGSPSIPKYEFKGKLTGSVAIINDDSICIMSIETGEVIYEMAR